MRLNTLSHGALSPQRTLWLETCCEVKSAVSSHFLAKFVGLFLLKRFKCFDAIKVNKTMHAKCFE